MQQIRRLLHFSSRPNLAMPPVLAATVLLALGSLILVAWQSPAPQSPQVESVWQQWLNNDVAYIIRTEEREAFNRLASDEERTMFVKQFWERREDNVKEEHYRRIAYANERFASNLPGWKTDRGRIYIVYGPPDELESHPSGSPARTAPYEQWLYNNIPGVGEKMIIEFVDRNSSGDYRMTSDPHPR